MDGGQDDPLQAEQRNRGRWRGEDEGGLGTGDAGGHLPPESERPAADEEKQAPHILPTIIPPD